MEIFIAYLTIINVLALVMFGVDKRRAVKNKWRIRESILLIFSLIGGGLGSFIGMKLFHHKTHKMKFLLLVPFFTIVFVIGIYFLNTLINIF